MSAEIVRLFPPPPHPAKLCRTSKEARTYTWTRLADLKKRAANVTRILAAFAEADACFSNSDPQIFGDLLDFVRAGELIVERANNRTGIG